MDGELLKHGKACFRTVPPHPNHLPQRHHRVVQLVHAAPGNTPQGGNMLMEFDTPSDHAGIPELCMRQVVHVQYRSATHILEVTHSPKDDARTPHRVMHTLTAYYCLLCSIPGSVKG